MEIQHRYFVQYMLKKGAVSLAAALNYSQNLPTPVTDIDNLKMLIIVVNREISKQNFKIVFGRCEVTQEQLLLWINTKNDEISRMQLTYNPVELEYFHVVMQEILNSDDFSLTYIRAINITSTLTVAYTRDSGQTVLNQWIKVGYFVKNGDCIYLGIRLILEFTLYLKSCRSDHVCSLCSELVFIGKGCGRCSKLFHSYCIEKYLDHENKCPSCNEMWTERETGTLSNSYIPVEEAESLSLSENTETSPGPSTSRRSLRKRANQN